MKASRVLIIGFACLAFYSVGYYAGESDQKEACTARLTTIKAELLQANDQPEPVIISDPDLNLEVCAWERGVVVDKAERDRRFWK